MFTTSDTILKAIFPPDGQTIPLSVARNWPAVELAVKQLAAAMNGEQNDMPAAGKAARTPEWYAARNERIYRIMDENPDAPARELARLAGVSEGVIKNLSRKKYRANSERVFERHMGHPTPPDILDEIANSDHISGSTNMIDHGNDHIVEPGEMVSDRRALDTEIVRQLDQRVDGMIELKPIETAEATIRNSRIVQKDEGVVADPGPAEPENPAIQANQGPENAEIPQEQATNLAEIPAQDQKPTIRESQTVEKVEQVKRAHDLTPSERGKIIGPRIPRTEDQWILDEKANGKTFREIREALQARGISCTMNDVMARYYDAKRKHELAAAGKKPANEPTSHEQGQLARQEGDKPAPKSISRADLNIRIWDAYQAGDSIEKISADLNSEGYYYNERQVRNRLKQQGANL